VAPFLCHSQAFSKDPLPLVRIVLSSWALVAHDCNPAYAGGRDQEDQGSMPAQANSSQDPILKKPSQKRPCGVAQGEGPEFKPQYHKKIHK
jgi:hypothetical protein